MKKLALLFSTVLAGCGSTVSGTSDSGHPSDASHPSACAPGEQIGCVCTTGAHGAQACNAAGTGYGACQCSGTKDGGTRDTSVDAPGHSGNDASIDAAKEAGGDAGACKLPALPDAGDKTGALNWAARFGATATTTTNGTSVAADPASGNLILAGYYSGSTDLGGGTISGGDAGGGGFVAGFSSAGNYRWGQAFVGNVEPYGASVDSSGNVVAGGNLTGTTDFGGGAVTATGPTDVFLAKYSSAGVYLWSKHFGMAGNAIYFRQAAFDSTRNLYVVGEPQGSPIDLGCGTLPSGKTMFVAKFGATGDCIWSNAYASYDATVQTNYTQSEVIAVDPTGYLLVAGGFYGTVDFGTGAMTAPGIGMDVFVQKLDLTGSVVWAKSFGSGGSVAQATGIAVDTCGSILLDGTFSNTINFGTGTLTESGDTGNGDIFLAKLDPTGAGLWSYSFGDPDTQLGGPLALDAAGGPSFTGSFSGMMNFGGGVLTGAADGNAAAYLTKFTSGGEYEWAVTGGPPASSADNSAGLGIASTRTSFVFAGQFQDGTLSLDGTNLTAVSEMDTYLASFIQ